MEYTVNNKTISYHAVGETAWGEDKILLDHAVDFTATTSWHAAGFSIEKLFPEEAYRAFHKQTHQLLLSLWREAGLSVQENFSPDQYHLLTKDLETHLAAIEKTKLLPAEMFPLGVAEIENRIAELCQQPVKAKNPFDGQSIFHFRVVRPNSRDNNPLHRDVWLEDYKDCINLYIPVAGSDERSSLIILPGSHLWPESRIERTIHGAVINNIKFNVPAVTSIKGDYSVTRPSPGKNELLIFSPYLIHGGAVNLNADTTRISIEMRLWKR